MKLKRLSQEPNIYILTDSLLKHFCNKYGFNFENIKSQQNFIDTLNVLLEFHMNNNFNNLDSTPITNTNVFVNDYKIKYKNFLDKTYDELKEFSERIDKHFTFNTLKENILKKKFIFTEQGEDIISPSQKFSDDIKCYIVLDYIFCSLYVLFNLIYFSYFQDIVILEELRNTDKSLNEKLTNKRHIPDFVFIQNTILEHSKKTTFFQKIKDKISSISKPFKKCLVSQVLSINFSSFTKEYLGIITCIILNDDYYMMPKYLLSEYIRDIYDQKTILFTGNKIYYKPVKIKGVPSEDCDEELDDFKETYIKADSKKAVVAFKKLLDQYLFQLD